AHRMEARRGPCGKRRRDGALARPPHALSKLGRRTLDPRGRAEPSCGDDPTAAHALRSQRTTRGPRLSSAGFCVLESTRGTPARSMCILTRWPPCPCSTAPPTRFLLSLSPCPAALRVQRR